MKKLTFLVLAIVTLQMSFAQKSSIFETQDGALKGFDVVAFHKDSAAKKGDKAFAYEWQNATWYFVNKDNLNAFILNPEQYAPQFGGYCAYGLSDNHKAPTETNTFTLIDGKLYFNYNNKVKTYWLKDTNKLITKANENWLQIKDVE